MPETVTIVEYRQASLAEFRRLAATLRSGFGDVLVAGVEAWARTTGWTIAPADG